MHRSRAAHAHVLLVLMLLVASCMRQGPDSSSLSDPVAIHPSRLDPGDQLAGMRIESIDASPDAVDATGWMGSVEFSGPATLTGRYRPHPEAPDVDVPCFYPDSASADLLPRFPNDTRTSWFCFTNPDEARTMLGAGEGEATIVINEFHYLYQHTDSYNTARLQQVLQRR